MGGDTKDGHCQACLQEQIDQNIPSASRTVILAKDCKKHGDTSQLLPDNVGYLHLYYALCPFHRIMALPDGSLRTTIDIQALEILCRHKHIDFNTAFDRVSIIHQGYYG
jgi:hypothetical protein